MNKALTCSQGHEWQFPEGGTPSSTGRGLACPVCGAAPSLEGLGAPAATVAALTRLRDELLRTAGNNLAGLILYGGLARGRYHPGKSDVNAVVLLHDVSAASLTAVAPALRAAWLAVSVEPLILTPAEVQGAAELFPTKFLDIRDYHVVLAGEDPFAGLEVDREHVRARIEQALRNLTLRLRRRFLAVASDPAALALALARVARPLAIELRALLRLAGKEVPAEDRTGLVLEAAAQAFELDREALVRVAQFRRQAIPADDLSSLYDRVLRTMAQAADLTRRMKETPP
jgi:hypothetical protein